MEVEVRPAVAPDGTCAAQDPSGRVGLPATAPSVIRRRLPSPPTSAAAGRRPSPARIQYADRDYGDAGSAPDLTPRTAANPPDRETSLLQGAKTGA
jgi:hypothetical protein